jgi:hypothetical protein
LTYVDELAVILAFALDYIQRDGDGEGSERNWLRDEIGGSIYLRLSTRPIEQNDRIMTQALRQAIVDGASRTRTDKPGLFESTKIASATAMLRYRISDVGAGIYRVCAGVPPIKGAEPVPQISVTTGSTVVFGNFSNRRKAVCGKSRFETELAAWAGRIRTRKCHFEEPPLISR